MGLEVGKALLAEWGILVVALGAPGEERVLLALEFVPLFLLAWIPKHGRCEWVVTIRVPVPSFLHLG